MQDGGLKSESCFSKTAPVWDIAWAQIEVRLTGSSCACTRSLCLRGWREYEPNMAYHDSHAVAPIAEPLGERTTR